MSDDTCRACGAILSPEDLACPACGQIVHVPELNALVAEAARLEPARPTEAIEVWNRVISLLPPESIQAQVFRQHIGTLMARPPAAPPSLANNIARSLGSMLISFAIYSFCIWYFSEETARNAIFFGGGFVLLILVHEMGHVVALRYYGVPASPPIFIPFVGAVINISAPRNALEESIVGIGGPVLGTVGALVCFQLYRMFPNPILLQLSYYGFLINLFNLLPVPPLDGGRITAAVTPWFWLPGLVGMGVLLEKQLLNPIALVIIAFGLPRIWQTFRHRDRMGDYYKVGSTATIVMGASYIGLALLLSGMVYYTNRLIGPMQ